MLQVSTSPRILLEFKDCKRDDWLDWNIKGAQTELAACAKSPEEAIALKAVDEETGEVAGYAVWGWSERVSLLGSVPACAAENPRQTAAKVLSMHMKSVALKSLQIGHRLSLSRQIRHPPPPRLQRLSAANIHHTPPSS